MNERIRLREWRKEKRNRKEEMKTSNTWIYYEYVHDITVWGSNDYCIRGKSTFSYENNEIFEIFDTNYLILGTFIPKDNQIYDLSKILLLGWNWMTNLDLRRENCEKTFLSNQKVHSSQRNLENNLQWFSMPVLGPLVCLLVCFQFHPTRHTWECTTTE